MALRIENTTLNDNSVPSFNTQAQAEQTNKTFSFGQKKDDNKDPEKPVEGYYVEKSQEEEPTIPNTSVDPNERITILPSIAINGITNEVTNAMEQAVNRAATELLGQTKDDSFLKGQSLVENNQFYNYFKDTNYPKRFNLYGKITYEGTNQKYINYEPESEISYARNSQRADLNINWKSKSERTKVFVFGSYTHTKTDFDLKIKASDETSSNSKHYQSFFVLGAAQHRLKNGDLIMGSASHIDNPVELSKLTTFNGSYYLKKYMTLAEGKTTLYKLADTKTITKTDFTISLNPELAFEKPKEENSSETETTPEIKQVLNPITKKWKTSFSPFFDTQAITGTTEEGLGIALRLNRTDENSMFRFLTFGKVSTTQEEENSKYHVTLGSGIKYQKNIGAKSLLKAEAEIKNRYTFGHENILTGSAHVLYTKPKFAIEAEAKSILISGDQPSYFAGVLRGYYTPNKKISFYGEGSYTYLKEQDSLLKGTNFQAGVILNL